MSTKDKNMTSHHFEKYDMFLQYNIRCNIIRIYDDHVHKKVPLQCKINKWIYNNIIHNVPCIIKFQKEAKSKELSAQVKESALRSTYVWTKYKQVNL